MLAGFEHRYLAQPGGSGPLPLPSDESSLRGRARSNGSASNYVDLPAGNGSISDSMSRKEQIREITERARPFYKAIWLRCSKEEKLTLIFIALDGFVSAENTELRHLIKRGLVLTEPRLRLMDEAFRHFVIAQCQVEDFRAWQQEGRSSLWETLRFPLMLLMLTLGIFLFTTQKDFFDSSIAIVTALGGGTAAILNLLGMFRRGKQAAE
jgi:hypothetical protein